METKIELKNVRLIESLKETFKSGNLYFVKGKNERGKTTFTLALKSILTGDVPSDMVTTGKEQGKIVGTITGANGKKYKVIINLKEHGNPSFKIIDDNLNISNKKSDLASIFNYTGITVEEFLGLGLTKPGREKQAKLLINTLPEEIQKKIYKLDDLLSPKVETSLYNQRKEVGILLKNIPIEKPSDNDFIKDQKLDDWLFRFEKEKKETNALLEKKNEIEREQALWEQKRETYERSVIEKENAVEEAKRALARAEAELEQAKENLSGLGEKPTLPDIDYEKKKTDIEKAVKIIEEAKAARQRVQKWEETNEKIKKLKEKQVSLTEEITQMRKERQELVSKHLNISGLVIEDGELKLETKDGLHDFTELNIAFSTASKKMLEIMLLLNPEYRIFTLGKASEFDSKTLKEMADFAEANDAIIVLDYVDKNTDELVITCEEHFNDEMDSTTKKEK